MALWFLHLPCAQFGSAVFLGLTSPGLARLGPFPLSPHPAPLGVPKMVFGNS